MPTTNYRSYTNSKWRGLVIGASTPYFNSLCLWWNINPHGRMCNPCDQIVHFIALCTHDMLHCLGTCMSLEQTASNLCTLWVYIWSVLHALFQFNHTLVLVAYWLSPHMVPGTIRTQFSQYLLGHTMLRYEPSDCTNLLIRWLGQRFFSAWKR